jgi:hypothetical protein
MELSAAGDKLPALSAVAQYFAAMLGEDYLAGLWRSRLFYD